MEAPIERKTMTIAEASEVLGVSRNKAYEAARRGQIPVIRIGKRLLVPRAALNVCCKGPRDGCFCKAVRTLQ